MKLLLGPLLLASTLAAPSLAADNPAYKSLNDYLIEEILRQTASSSHHQSIEEQMEVETTDIPNNPYCIATVVAEESEQNIQIDEKPVGEKEAASISRDVKILAKNGIMAKLDLFPININSCFTSIPHIFTVHESNYTFLSTPIIDKGIQLTKELRKGLKQDINESKRTLLFDFCQNRQKIGQMELSLSDYFTESIEINFTFHPEFRKKAGIKFHNDMTSVLSLLLSNIKQLAQQNNRSSEQKINHIIMNTFYTQRNEELELIQTAIDALSDPHSTNRMLQGPLDHPFYNDLYIYFTPTK